ncbi:hypothetical protein CGX12_16610 [Zobellella denitrificans]|uniref:DUF2570 domain-containing protein n=1 Tax=Zobellella denitrificans TaxID=347534 RepID=UPI000B8BFAE1|nr:DUF2570 domain-containing protein [Zobellella denitrificans]OXS14002.1 hypothetical protein CGX12_16610 [Zobellella denitrificans]
MSKLAMLLLIMLALLLFMVWSQQAMLDRLAGKLGRSEARAELLAGVTQEQQQTLARLQQAQQEARRLLQEQQERLQQADTDTRSYRHAVQQHIFTPLPGRPDCSREPLPAAVVGLLGAAATGRHQAGADTATAGPAAGVP